MAVVKYSLSLDAAGNPQIDPSPDSVLLRTGDYMEFSTDVEADILVQLTGGPSIVCAVASGEGDSTQKVMVNPPTLDGDGNFVISFANEGGAAEPPAGFP